MSQKPKVEFRRLTPDDDQITFQWRNTPAIYNWCRQFDVLHRDEHSNWIKTQSSDKSISMYMICDDSGVPVGVCGLTSIDQINRRAEFSIYIGPQHQEAGYGESALRKLVRRGFHDYGLNSIWGEVFDGNPAMRMFKRVGFKEEGRRRSFYFRDGKFIDAILISMLRSEYA